MEPSSSSDSSHNPRVRGSWARRTGFKTNLSGESGSAVSDTESRDVEMGMGKGLPSQVAAVAAPAAAATAEPPSPAPDSVVGGSHGKREVNGSSKVKEKEGGSHKGPDNHVKLPTSSHSAPAPPTPLPTVPTRITERMRAGSTEGLSGNNSGGQIRIEPIKGYKDTEMDLLSQSQDADSEHLAKQSHMKYEIRETPGHVPMALYGIQHYLSMIGSLILIPLVIVPAMGGDDKDTAYVVSTVFLVSGISTLLHSFFGSRLPLIQGASFVYLAPALAIINSSDFTSIGSNRFKDTMRELQ